ncbi:MAG: 2-phosphosulfolactate phosphatase, partial [Chloroflexota bacterium]
SPEANAAAAAFRAQRDNLLETLLAIPSGVELVDWGYGQDVEIAAQYNASTAAPRFRSVAYYG